MIPIEPLVTAAAAPVNSGGGGGATLAIVGDVTTASTAIETLVTLANMAVALLVLLVALAIADCTETAVAVGVRMRTSTMTLPGDMVNSTADGSTPARAAIALLIWDWTLEVNEETSPASRRVNPTTLGGGDGGGGGEGGGGDGGGGATLAIVGDVTTASTMIGTLVTLTNMAVTLLGLLVALAIADCTETAVAVGVRMRTSTMTLPGDMVNSTADGSTPARTAIALLIWDWTLEVNEETSPASRRVNPTTLIASGEGEGEGGEAQEHRLARAASGHVLP